MKNKYNSKTFSSDGLFFFLKHKKERSIFRREDIIQLLSERGDPKDIINLVKYGEPIVRRYRFSIARTRTKEYFSLEHFGIRHLNSLHKLSNTKEWRHLSEVDSFVKRYEKFIRYNCGEEFSKSVKKALRSCAKSQKKCFQLFYCTRDSSRFSWPRGSYCPSCRKCGCTQYSIKVRKVIAILDDFASWKSYYQNDTLWINVLKNSKRYKLGQESFLRLFDFDCIEIGNCSTKNIHRFCLAIGGDDDKIRTRGYKHISYRLIEGASLDEQTRLLLNRFFKGETFQN